MSDQKCWIEGVKCEERIEGRRGEKIERTHITIHEIQVEVTNSFCFDFHQQQTSLRTDLPFPTHVNEQRSWEVYVPFILRIHYDDNILFYPDTRPVHVLMMPETAQQNGLNHSNSLGSHFVAPNHLNFLQPVIAWAHHMCINYTKHLRPQQTAKLFIVVVATRQTV